MRRRSQEGSRFKSVELKIRRHNVSLDWLRGLRNVVLTKLSMTVTQPIADSIEESTYL